MNPLTGMVDRSHFTGIKRVQPDKLAAAIRDSLGRKTAISTGRFETDCECDVRDMDWNHMDQEHRPWVHHTYQEAVRLAVGNDFAVSLTKLRFLGLPLLIEVTDIRLGPGLFYQTFNLFNVFFFHVVISMIPRQTPEGEKCKVVAEWHIASHWLAKMFHGMLSRRLERLNKVQNLEDVEIRQRRFDLRSRGYGFSSDEPDFISSNAMTLNTRPPRLQKTHHVSLAGLPVSQPARVALEALELLILRRPDDSLVVWPGACPHEGADLSLAKRCDEEIVGVTGRPLKPKSIRMNPLRFPTSADVGQIGHTLLPAVDVVNDLDKPTGLLPNFGHVGRPFSSKKPGFYRFLRTGQCN